MKKIIIAGILAVMSSSAYAESSAEILANTQAAVLQQAKIDAFICADTNERCERFQNSNREFTPQGKKSIQGYLNSISNSDEFPEDVKVRAQKYKFRTAYF